MANWPTVRMDTNRDDSLCFACGQNNPIGLKLNFRREGSGARADFTPGEHFQGWPGLVHGGITVLLLDEAMTYAVLFAGLNAVTAKIEAKIKKPVGVNEPLTVTATVLRKTRKIVETSAMVTMQDGSTVAEANATHFVVSPVTKEAAPGKSRAVIWDLDGVIADTAPFHLAAWEETFRRRGIAFSAEAFRRTFGQRNDAIIKSVLGDNVSPAEIDSLGAEKETCFRHNINGKVKALPGVIELIRALRQHGFRQVVASSAPAANVRLVLDNLGITPDFQAVISGDEVPAGKPAPDIFLRAARRLGVPAGDCIVIEDAVAGITAAKRAGMRCVAVTTSHPRHSLAEADLVVDSLKELNVETLEKLLVNASRLM